MLSFLSLTEIFFILSEVNRDNYMNYIPFLIGCSNSYLCGESETNCHQSEVYKSSKVPQLESAFMDTDFTSTYN